MDGLTFSSFVLKTFKREGMAVLFNGTIDNRVLVHLLLSEIFSIPILSPLAPAVFALFLISSPMTFVVVIVIFDC